MEPHSNYESCILADLFYKVPVLISFLSPESLANVLACNRELRRYMHQLIWKVPMANEKGIQLLSKHNWSQLSVVLMPKDRYAYNSAWPKHSTLQLLATIWFSQQGYKSTAFWLELSSLHQSLNKGCVRSSGVALLASMLPHVSSGFLNSAGSCTSSCY